jgi:nucleoside-diphosphate-sugar epimerase
MPSSLGEQTLMFGHGYACNTGLGYTGVALANYVTHMHPGWTVLGTSRSGRPKLPIADSVHVVQSENDVTMADSVTHILSTIPPLRDGRDPVLDHVVNKYIYQSDSEKPWVGYVSTTSVYGNHGGQQVWEDSEIFNASSDRYRVEQSWFHEAHAHIFRCGGIYGPYRNVVTSLIQSAHGGGSISQKKRRQRSATARCHVYDVCQVIAASMIRNYSGQGDVYNIVDDDCASRRVVEAYVFKNLWNSTMPSLQQSDSQNDMAPPEKIVMNSKIKNDLGIVLKYPTYKDGLNAIILDNDTQPFPNM